MTRNAWRSAAALLLALGALAGCESSTGPDDGPDLTKLDPGIHPIVVVRERNGTMATVELRLHRVQVPASIGSFQAEMRFEPDRLELREVTFVDGVVQAWEEATPGRMRIAGARLEGLPDGAVLTFRVQVKKQGALDAKAFRIEVEELRSASDFADLLPLLVDRSRPLFSNAPID